MMIIAMICIILALASIVGLVISFFRLISASSKNQSITKHCIISGVTLSLAITLTVLSALCLPDSIQHTVSTNTPPTLKPANVIVDLPKKSEKNPDLFSGDEYLKAVASFLILQELNGNKVSDVATGLESGRNTLENLKSAIKAAKMNDFEAWVKTCDKYFDASATIPAEYLHIHNELYEIRNSRRDSYEEMLKYWDDSNDAHIDSGSRAFSYSINKANKLAKQVASHFEPDTSTKRVAK